MLPKLIGCRSIIQKRIKCDNMFIHGGFNRNRILFFKFAFFYAFHVLKQKTNTFMFRLIFSRKLDFSVLICQTQYHVIDVMRRLGIGVVPLA